MTFVRGVHTIIDSQLHLLPKCFSLALPCRIVLFTVSKWKKMEKRVTILQYRVLSIKCIVKHKCQLGQEYLFKFFLQIPPLHSYIHTHTMTLLLVSFCTQCWLTQRRPGLRFHPHLTERILTTQTVVNIRTKHSSGTSHQLWTCRRVNQWTKW